MKKALPPPVTNKNNKTSSSQMEDGSAANARTTTSREESHASDAKKISVTKTAKESQSTWPLPVLNKEKVRKPRKNQLLKLTVPMISKRTTESTSTKP